MGGVKVGWKILGVREVECRRAEGRRLLRSQTAHEQQDYGLGEVCIGRRMGAI